EESQALVDVARYRATFERGLERLVPLAGAEEDREVPRLRPAHHAGLAIADRPVRKEAFDLRGDGFGLCVQVGRSDDAEGRVADPLHGWNGEPVAFLVGEGVG